MQHAVPALAEIALAEHPLPGLPQQVVARALLAAGEQPQHLDGADAAEQRGDQRLDHAGGAVDRPRVAPALQVVRLRQVPAGDRRRLVPLHSEVDPLLDLSGGAREVQIRW